jgi:hypothetical protein
MSTSQEAAFPRLSTAEIAVLKPLATAHDYVDGDVLFRAGQADIDLFVVESGLIDVLSPADGSRVIVTHEPGGRRFPGSNLCPSIARDSALNCDIGVSRGSLTSAEPLAMLP